MIYTDKKGRKYTITGYVNNVPIKHYVQPMPCEGYDNEEEVTALLRIVASDCGGKKYLLRTGD